MTQRYLIRIAVIVLVLAIALGAALCLKPAKTDHEKWRFFRVGQTSATSSGMTGDLAFMRVDATSPVVDSLALLPGGLAFLPKKAAPLFGHRAAASDAVADVVLPPEKCLLVRQVTFVQAPPANGSGGGRVLLSVDAATRLRPPSAKLQAALPKQCAATNAMECQVVIWLEARPKKCG